MILIAGLSACVADAVPGGSQASGPRATGSEDGNAVETGNGGATFGEALGPVGTARYLSPADMAEAIEGVDVVVVGEVSDLVEGRREVLLGPEGDPTSNYVQYYDVVLRPSEVVKGDAPTAEDVHVEFAWPNNQSTEKLSAALPRGARAIALGGRPDGAEPTTYTLLQVPPYGLVFETSSGHTQLPFEGDRELHDVLGGSDEMTFDEARTAIVNAAAQ
ncbi:MAG: hypothetical protein OEZ06_24360 [Myxococcales bacterium]|nr:hypothetical protein [Myxococcales bacterium]